MNDTTAFRNMPRPVAVSRSPFGLERKFDRLRYRDWFRGKELTTDWTSGNFTLWRRVLSPLQGEPLRILEIGSWEGRSAIFFLNFFKRATITCVDTFGGGVEHRRLAMEISAVEGRFDRNLGPFGSRVEKIKNESRDGLEWLEAQQRRYDLAYIDGSHMRDEVMADSRGVWSLVGPGGVIIWDDYRYGRNLPAEERPQPAIDAFLSEHDGAFRMLAKGYQVIIERTA
jgi:predicted O-methyltransferase YrrM